MQTILLTGGTANQIASYAGRYINDNVQVIVFHALPDTKGHQLPSGAFIVYDVDLKGPSLDDVAKAFDVHKIMDLDSGITSVRPPINTAHQLSIFTQ